MAVPVSELQAPVPPQRRPWRWLTVAFGSILLAIAVLVLGFAAGLWHPDNRRGLPSFPSLAEQPDTSLHGTVAYFANGTGCVRIVAAAGQPAKDVLCIPQQDLAVKPELGVKPAGPQLVWRPDGRLEVTMFFWSPVTEKQPAYHPSWQKIVDPRTGAVEDVPASQLPAGPNETTQPTVNPRGERVGTVLDAATGRVKVTLTGSGGTRVLLSTQGPGEYSYRFGAAFWAPNWQWIAAGDDGRILIITPDKPATTRVLVTGSGEGAGGGTAGPAFAITGADLLTTAR